MSYSLSTTVTLPMADDDIFALLEAKIEPGPQ